MLDIDIINAIRRDQGLPPLRDPYSMEGLDIRVVVLDRFPPLNDATRKLLEDVYGPSVWVALGRRFWTAMWKPRFSVGEAAIMAVLAGFVRAAIASYLG